MSESTRNLRSRIGLRLEAARHEIRCRQCRVTWVSWLQRIVGDPRGMTPRIRLPKVAK